MNKLLLIGLLAVAGCVTKNPDPTGPKYVVDPRLNSASNQVKGFTDALKPVNPYAGITDYAIAGGFGLAALISGVIARRKSNVADTIAAGAVKAGPTAVQAILDHAAGTDHLGDVAKTINDNTGANQKVTGSPA